MTYGGKVKAGMKRRPIKVKQMHSKNKMRRLRRQRRKDWSRGEGSEMKTEKPRQDSD